MDYEKTKIEKTEKVFKKICLLQRKSGKITVDVVGGGVAVVRLLLSILIIDIILSDQADCGYLGADRSRKLR